MTLLQRVCVAVLLVLSVYVGAYLHLSRRGDAWCRRHNWSGFLYVLPGDCEDYDRWHYACIRLFRPLNDLDRALGGELVPCSCAGFGLAK